MTNPIVTRIATMIATGILEAVAKNNEKEIVKAKEKLAKANAKAEKIVAKAEEQLLKTHDAVMESTQIVTEAMKLGSQQPDPLPKPTELR